MKLICNRFGALLVVAGAMAFTGVVMGQAGPVVAWGDNAYGQCNVPTTLGPCIKVTGGGFTTQGGWSLAIKTTGTVVGWGSNSFGQCGTDAEKSGVGAFAFWTKTTLSTCTQIAAGYSHSVGLKENGTVVAWGDNSNNKCNVPSNLGICIQIACGGENTLALQADGTVVAWGYGGNNVPPLQPSKFLSAGEDFGLVIQTDGIVKAWGSNVANQCNVPSDLGSCIALSAGILNTVVIKSDGSVRAWGSNGYGCSNVPTALAPCKQVESGEYHTVVLTNDGTVIAWGQNLHGESTIPNNLGACSQIGTGYWHSLAIQAPPTISGVLPISGPAIGGTPITITGTGTGFRSSSVVTIGGKAATDILVISSTKITATTPDGFPGPAVVTVDGGSSTAFYYRPTCGADLDNNNVVDSADLGYLLLEFGNCSSESAAATEPVEPVQIPMIEQTPLAAKK